MRELLAKEFFVDPDIRKAESLPSYAFCDPEFLSLELDAIFNKTWVIIPPQQEQLRPGSRVPFNLLGRPLFVQLNSKNELNCFSNVCTHAWYPLVQSATAGGSIVCPQHGREFDADGKFKAHKGFENLEGFPRESDNLTRLKLESWGPLKAVCLSNPLNALNELVGVVKESTPGIHLESLKYKPVAKEVREVEGNWKQHAWNYMDNYHIRFVHKGPGGLSDAIELDSYTTELYQYSALQWAYARDPEHGFRPEQVASRFRDPKHPEKRVFALWWFIFPNITMNLYPWGLSVNQYLPIPGNPERTEFNWYQYALDDEKFEQREEFWLNQQVDAEDIEAIALVCRGARSGFAPRGRFAPNEEAGPHWFHRRIYTTVFQN